MARVMITAQVEDSVKWEKGFRTHGELLRSMSSTVSYFTTTDKNEIAIYAEPSDLDKYFKVFESPATAAAMAHDGVKRETVKVFVLDREFRY
ncbi:MAG TPA: hypothetical protein DCK99_17125 [Blastocatellia bacterium]|nr:hypothetical protein [Blastocatellia bacterium]